MCACQGEGSLFACLQTEGLATGVSSGLEAPRDFCLLSVSISLTPRGEASLTLVLTRLYEYVAVLATAGGGPGVVSFGHQPAASAAATNPPPPLLLG